MSGQATKLVQCFLLARRVNHFYWMHTEGDDRNGRVSIENLQRVIERMTRLRVYKTLNPFEGRLVRGNFERYADRILIRVRASQPEFWLRFTVVKELCHALLFTMESFSTDGVKILRDLLHFSGFNSSDMSEEAQWEKVAEIMALELIYPLELRKLDAALPKTPGLTAMLAARRGVPALWIERGIDADYIRICDEIWGVMPAIPDTDELGPPNPWEAKS